jgi:hypothetical protein
MLDVCFAFLKNGKDLKGKHFLHECQFLRNFTVNENKMYTEKNLEHRNILS